MSTKNRLQELHVINNNIVCECNKMAQYLETVKERSAYAVTNLDSQNIGNILRRFSSTYEYLKRLYIKILDQNCAFELFFMELNELLPIDPNSAQSSAKCSTAESTYFDSTACYFTESKHTLDTIMYQNVHGSIPKDTINSIANTTSNSSDIIRTKTAQKSGKTKNLNVNAAEFEPRSSIAVKMDKPSSANTAVLAKEIDTKKVPSHCASTSKAEAVQNDKEELELTVATIRNINNEILPIQNSSPENKDQWASTYKAKNDQEELVSPIENLTDETMREIIRKIDERKRQYELKTSVVIPDLRPRIVRNKSHSSNALQVYEPKEIPTQTKSEHEHIPKNRNNTPIEKHSMEQFGELALKRGPPPKEGDLCFISYVESLSLFYIHVIRDETTVIDCLSEQIAEISRGLKSFKNKTQAAKGIKEYCVCKIPYYSWCRAQITDWMMGHEQLIEVLLIDYGVSCKVGLKNIREANEFIFVAPAMADKCELAWVKPLENRCVWPMDAINHFFKIIDSADRLFTISYVEEKDDHIIIDLQSNEINSVAGLMVSDGKAALDDESDDEKQWTNDFMKQQIMKAQGLSAQDLKQTEENKLESLMDDDEDDEVSNPNLAVSHYNARDEREICRIFLLRGYCFKGNNCPFSHTPLNPDGWTTDRQAVFFEAFNQLQLPKDGEEVKIKVLYLYDFKKFYATIKDLPQCTNLIGMPINNIYALCKLLNDPDEVKTYKKLVVIPAIAEIILVYNGHTWARARVIGIEEFANRVELEVIMVDCGKKQRFDMKLCRKIEAKHLHLPFQAVLCSLSNVAWKDDVPERDIEMGLDYLEMNIVNKKLTAQVKFASQYLNIQLFLDNGQDVGEELIKAGIVNRCTRTFFPISDVFSLE